MRLTLRTLLAWLDDTLQPTQVKEIGSQVAGSPFAQELTERIHRVTRQRRLSVPSSSGPDGIDPNLVASYLDNELDPDAVAEYEKKCLSHDVNLAEVASVHQILSLLGHKVKVPAAARSRMYGLVKGRDSTRPEKPANPRADLPEPLTKPINPWIVPEAPQRPAYARFGPAIACLALIASCSWAAWKSLTASPPEAFRVPHMNGGAVNNPTLNPIGKDVDAAADSKVASALVGANDATMIASEPGAGVPEPASDTAKAKDMVGAGAAKVADAAGKSAETGATPAAPVGSAGLAAAPEGILLRYNTDLKEWERLAGPTPLASSNRLLCLIPSRATIAVGKTQVIMVGESEIRILPQSTDAAPAIELIQGRLLWHPDAAGSLKVGLADRIVTLHLPHNGRVALERPARWVYGRLVSPIPPLVITCINADMSVLVDNKLESLSPLDTLTVDRTGVKHATEEALPPWASQSEPAARDIQARDRFTKVLHSGRPVLTEIVAATEDQDADIKQLSMLALKSMGDMSYLLPLLSRKDDRAVRRGALAAIRSYTALGPEAAGRVRDQLIEEFGEDSAAFAGKMIVGFSSQETADPKPVVGRLIEMLSPEETSLGLRELAIDTLMRLTGYDDQGYDPDHPDGKALAAWKDLERQGKLRVTSPRAKAK
jgi:hypothetical protein